MKKLCVLLCMLLSFSQSSSVFAYPDAKTSAGIALSLVPIMGTIASMRYWGHCTNQKSCREGSVLSYLQVNKPCQQCVIEPTSNGCNVTATGYCIISIAQCVQEDGQTIEFEKNECSGQKTASIFFASAFGAEVLALFGISAWYLYHAYHPKAQHDSIQ